MWWLCGAVCKRIAAGALVVQLESGKTITAVWFGLWKTVLEKCFVISYFRCWFQVRYRLFIFKLYRKSFKLREILTVSVNSVFCLSSGQTSQALFHSAAVFGKVLFVLFFSSCAFFSFPLKFPHKTVHELVKTVLEGLLCPGSQRVWGGEGGRWLQGTEKCHFIIDKTQMRKIVCMFVSVRNESSLL